MKRWIGVFVSAALTVTGLTLAASEIAEGASATCPVVAAHRTAPLDAPENTVVGIEAAADLDVPLVEVDVRWSVSGYPVLMHDETVDRTTNGTGVVSQTGLGALTALKAQDYAPWKGNPAYDAVKVPYAWDFLNAAKVHGVDLLLDISLTPSKAAMDKLVEYLDMFDYRSHVIVMGNKAGVKAMWGWYPALHYWNIEYPPADYMKSIKALKALGVTTYGVPVRELGNLEQAQAFVDYYHSNDIQVAVWTSDNPSGENVWDSSTYWSLATEAGVDYIITNVPVGARSVCG